MDKTNIIGVLNNCYSNLKQEGPSASLINYLVENLKIRTIVNHYIKSVDNYDVDDRVIVELLVRILQEIYNNSGLLVPVPDDEYDQLYEVHRDINEGEIVGASVGARDRLISHHKYPDLRGTLDKAHFFQNEEKSPKEKRKSLQDWVSRMERRLGRELTKKEKECHAFLKWDGLSVIFECDTGANVEKALTRGDTDKNEAVDVSAMFRGVNMAQLYIFEDGPFGVKTEVIITEDMYKKLCEKYGEFNSMRSAVTSILNSKELDTSMLRFLTVVPLQVQSFETKQIEVPKQMFDMYPTATVNLDDWDSVKEATETLRAYAIKHGIPIDGIVFRLKDENVCKELGRENHINRYEIAYKFPALQTKTILKDVIFSVGLMGGITPVAKVEPRVMKGNTVKSINLGSIDIFEEMELREGDELILKYDIIPTVTIDETCKKGHGQKFITITNCPVCDSKLVRDPQLRCANENCSSRKIGKIMNYVEKMRIPNISIGIITKFFNEGIVTGIADLYDLKNKRDLITSLDGFGRKLFEKIVKGIQSRRDVYEYELLGSLGIPMIGERMFKKILNIYYLDDVIKYSIEEKIHKFTTIKGVQEKTAEKIIEGITLNYDLLKFLRSVLNVKRDERKYTIKVAFSKIRDKDFEEFLDVYGVMVLDSYSSEVDMLIIKDEDSTSSKIDKARADGKKVVTIKEAYQIFSYKK